MKKNQEIIRGVVEAMGGEFKEVIPARNYYEIAINGQVIKLFNKFRISDNPLWGAEETKYKDITYYLLKNESIPTPETVCLYRKNGESAKEIEKKLSSLDYPIIIKDAEGSQSRGIYANILTAAEAVKTIQEAFKSFSNLIAQPMVSGNEYRVTILGKKVIGALKMIPPRIIGDGESSVAALIEQKQKNLKSKTPLDSFLDVILKEQGFGLSSVPPSGKMIYIRKSSVLAEGGETEDATDRVHRGIKKYCVSAARATGKKLAGLDVICEDISKDPEKQKFSIIEVNGRPDIYIHYEPTYGETRDVVKEIINFILKLKRKNG